jgi:hypothetical protein
MRAAAIAIAALLLATGTAHAESELEEWLAQCKKGDQHACQIVRSITGSEGLWATYKDRKLINTKGSHVWACFNVDPVIAKTRKRADRKCWRAQLEAQKRQDK